MSKAFNYKIRKILQTNRCTATKFSAHCLHPIINFEEQAMKETINKCIKISVNVTTNKDTKFNKICQSFTMNAQETQRKKFDIG